MSVAKTTLNTLYARLKQIAGRGPTTLATLLVPEYQSRGKVYPDISFDKLNNIQIGDPDTAAAIDMIAGQVTRGGFETSMDEKYTKKVGDRTAKEFIDDKCQEFGLDQIIKEDAADVIGYGESVLWKNNGGNAIEFLVRIMPSSFKSFNFDEIGLNFKSLTTNRFEFSAEKLIRFSYNRIGKKPVGFGILQALGTALKYNNTTRAPMVEIKAKIMEAMQKQIEEFSAPNQMWVLPDATDEKLPTYHEMIQKLKKGQRITYNKAGAQVINAVPERMRGMDLYVETLWNSYYLALQTPIPQLFTGRQLTQASATAALGIAEIGKIDDLRRYLKRLAEQKIFASWLEEEGLEPLKARVRLNWRLMQRPDTNVLLPSVVKLREMRDISQKEIRTILRDMGLPIDPNAKVEEEKPVKKPRDIPGAQSKPFDQPIVSEEKKYKARREEGRFA